MRTLKKTLCLVLVLAMMVGLCAMGASAATIDDYKDKDTIQNKEAVAVLTKIGVFEGDDQGNFRGTATLTRAESAALMTRFMAATGAGTSSFTDMGAYAWAQPYVAFCEGNKIIAGLGDGTFGPEQTLTVVQFAKMMICALGYDPVREGLIGNAWEINTIKLINKLDLAAGLTNLDYNAAITRDAAAQMAYNTLRATMVEYVGGTDINVSTGDGTTVEVKDNIQATSVVNNSYDYRGEMGYDARYDEILPIIDGLFGIVRNTMEFCENYFPNLKLELDDEDSFGMPVHKWFMGDSRKDTNWTAKKQIVSELAGTIMATYDANIFVTEKQLYADAKLDRTHPSLTIKENGVTVLDKDGDAFEYSPSRTDGETLAFLNAKRNYSGATILLVDTSEEGDSGYGIADLLVVKYPLLAKVTKVNAASATADRSVTLTVYDQVGGTASFPYTTEKFAKNDMILVYPKMAMGTTIEAYKTAHDDKNPSILAADAAESVNGLLTKVGMRTVTPAQGDPFAMTTALTVGGVVYSIGANANLGPVPGVAASGAPTNYTLNYGITNYLTNGFVIGVATDAIAYGDYVFAITSAQKDGDLLTEYKYPTVYVTQDGKVVTTEFANVGKETIEDKGIIGYQDVATTWAGITEVGSTSRIKLSDLTKEIEFDTKKKDNEWVDFISPSHPVIGWDDDENEIIADANTKFVLRTGTSTFKTYTGISSLPAYEGNLEGWALVPSYPGAHAAAIYIEVTGADPTDTTATTIFLTSKNPVSWTTTAAGTTVYTYNTIVDGKVVPVDSDKSSLPYDGLVIPTYDGNKLLTAVTPAFDGVAAYGTAVEEFAYTGNILSTEYYSYTLGSGAVCYIFDSNKGIITATITDFSELEGEEGYFWATSVSKTDNSLKTMYLVQPLPSQV